MVRTLKVAIQGIVKIRTYQLLSALLLPFLKNGAFIKRKLDFAWKGKKWIFGVQISMASNIYIGSRQSRGKNLFVFSGHLAGPVFGHA